MSLNFTKTLASIRWAFIQILLSGKGGLLVLALFSFAQSLFPLANVYVLKALAESLTQEGLHSAAPGILISWALVILADNIITHFSQVTHINVNGKVTLHFNQLLMEKANSFLGIAAIESNAIQDEIAVLKEETKFKPINLMYIITDAVKAIITIGSILALLGTLSSWLPLIMISSFLPQIFFAFSAEKSLWDYSLFHSRESRMMERLCSLSVNPSVAKEIRIYDCGNLFSQKFRLLAVGFYEKLKSTRKRQFFMLFPLVLLATGGQLSVIFWMAWKVNTHVLSIAAIITIIQSLFYLQKTVLTLIQDMGCLSSVTAYFQTFHKFIHRDDPQRHAAKITSLLLPIKSITFQNVSFSYEGEPLPILKNLTFSISQGEKVAIVGKNGCGKSTLIKLLCRFYDPQEGKILINQTNLNTIAPREWRKQLSAIFQDFGRYPLSFGENVGISSLPYLQNKRKIEEAILKGGLHHLYCTFPEGLDTQMGKEFSGKELSYGEWQKIALSRLYFRDAPIVIMDEPTASLDPCSEYECFQHLLHALEGKTVFLITHRLNSVKMYDKILLLQDGHILEEGTHSNLMKLEGEYARLFSLQSSGYNQIPLSDGIYH